MLAEQREEATGISLRDLVQRSVAGFNGPVEVF